MARDITSAFITEVTADQLHPILLFKGELDSGDLLFWSGVGELSYDGDTYIGSGDLLKVEAVEETQELTANTVAFELSGIPSSLISLALAEDYQGRPVTIFFAVLDDAGALVSDPYQLFSGQFDVMTISDSGNDAKIIMNAESDLVALRVSRERRYTPEDQKADYPNDLGLDFVPLIQDIELTWGAGRTD
jgi:hypothetical protein